MELEVVRLLESIEKARSYKKKFNITSSNQNNHRFKEVFIYAYSPNYKYYIKVPKSESFRFKRNPKLDTREKRWEYWEELADRLTNRKISGNNAKNKIYKFLESCLDRERKWYCRIINRDLRIGLGPTTVKKIWFGVIPEIEHQLATLYKEETVLPDEIVLEPKLDGLRNITFITGSNVECYSRNGERFYYFENQILDNFKENEENIVLDGEMFWETWNKTQSAVQSGNGIENVIFYVFDIMTQDEYFNRSTESLKNRKQNLRKFLSSAGKLENLKRISEHYIQSKRSSVMEWFRRYVKQGYEGVIIKDLNAKYKFKRSNDWIKIKAQDYDVFLCVEVKEGTGQNEGKLGALIVEDKEGNRIGVGQGFSDEQREKFWKNPPVGKYIEISFLTSKHKKSVATNPVFIRVREDIS